MSDSQATSDNLTQIIDNVRRPWVKSPYYDVAENWTFVFWKEGRHFRDVFETLPKGYVIELACGHGRHAEIAAPMCDTLHLVDVIEENLEVCRGRLSQFNNIIYSLGSGATFPDVGAEQVDMIYCYDAMVHFAPEIVEAYLEDTARVLRSGGKAFYHHSNYADGKGKIWNSNPQARNYMTKDLFAEMARKVGLTVESQVIMAWGGVPDLDCATLLSKP